MYSLDRVITARISDLGYVCSNGQVIAIDKHYKDSCISPVIDDVVSVKAYGTGEVKSVTADTVTIAFNKSTVTLPTDEVTVVCVNILNRKGGLK